MKFLKISPRSLIRQFFSRNAFFSQQSFFLMLTRCSLSVRALKGFSLIFGFKNGRFRVKIQIKKAFSTEI